MSGNHFGGVKASHTNRIRHGEDYYARLGRIGGSAKVPKGFALMDKQKVSEAGKKGGHRSKRGRDLVPETSWPVEVVRPATLFQDHFEAIEEPKTSWWKRILG